MDVIVENHGSLFLLWPQSQAGETWLREHTRKDAQWWCPGRGGLTRAALVVEPHYVADIVEGAVADGLEVK